MVQKANPPKDSSSLDAQGLPAREQRVRTYLPQTCVAKRTGSEGLEAAGAAVAATPALSLIFSVGSVRCR